jgi:SAM-dependent methyltransferase
VKQDKIWEYFQGEGVDNFAGAVPRLDFLFRKAKRLSTKRNFSVLNIGVGDGWLERRCLEQGWRTHTLDPSRTAIENLADMGVTATTGYIESIPYGGETFDVVFCSEVLEHLDDDQFRSGLREVKRVLKPGGYLIGTVPFNEKLAESTVICPDCGNVFHRWGHTRSFDKRGLGSELVGAGFEVVALKTYAFPDPAKGSGALTVRQWLRWFLCRIGSGLVYANLFFMGQPVSRIRIGSQG